MEENGEKLVMCVLCPDHLLEVPLADLSEHMANHHTGYKPFKCPHCHLYASKLEMRSLFEAKKAKMGSTMKLCMYCSRYETRVPAQLLSEHIGNYHSGYKPFRCGHCDWKTTTPRIMQIHIAEQHPGKGEIMVHHHNEVLDQYHRILFHTSNANDIAFTKYLDSHGVEVVLASEAATEMLKSETAAMAGLDGASPPTPHILHCALCNKDGEVGYPTLLPDQPAHALAHLIKSGNRHPLPAGVEMMRRVCFPTGGVEEPGEEVVDVVGVEEETAVAEGGVWTSPRSRGLSGLDWGAMDWKYQPSQGAGAWGVQTRQMKSKINID